MPLGGDDLAQIHRLYATYNHAIDDGDGDRFAACFTPDAELFPGGGEPFVGTDAIAAFAKGVPGSFPGIRHTITNIVVDGDGDTADGAAYLVVIIAGAEPKLMMTGRYNDSLRRVTGTWLFSRRDFTPDR